MRIMADENCRIVIDPPASGAWNMAVDAALLESAVEDRLCAVRWYQWAEPTLSLGYFQDQPESEETLSCLPNVRRLSGGGAIVHDRELTYACVVPAGHPLSRVPQDLYAAVHGSIAVSLQRRGFPVAVRGTSLAAKRGEFLCFGRGDELDLVVGETKVLGSAQRRRKGAVLQHGSLILTFSPWAPQFPGLLDLCGNVDPPPTGEWLAELGQVVSNSLSRNSEFGPLPDRVLRQAAQGS